MKPQGSLFYDTSEVPGAWPNGTRVEKTASSPGDAHNDGAQATVRQSLGPVHGTFGYYVEWDDLPGMPVFTAGTRLRKVEPKT